MGLVLVRMSRHEGISSRETYSSTAALSHRMLKPISQRKTCRTFPTRMALSQAMTLEHHKGDFFPRDRREYFQNRKIYHGPRKFIQITGVKFHG
jgi:hypothetical protein